MKKFYALLLSLVVIISLAGCAIPVSMTKTNNSESSGEVAVKEPSNSSNSQSDNQNGTPITIDQLDVDVTIKEPDSIGTVYMDATYTNNSNCNLTGLSITVLLKDKNEKTYLSSYDTVLPGETSPTFESFGPETLRSEDIEFLEYSITVVNEDGSKTYVDYDCKLKSYKVW